MKQKAIGIATLVSITIMVIVGAIILLEGEFFSASNLQLLIILFTLSIVLTGIYLMGAHCPNIKKNIQIPISLFGIVLVVFSVLVAYNYIDFLKTFNWLISGGIFFLLLVQLQLLNWGQKTGILTKTFSFITILSNLFLIVFFIVKWKYSAIAIWIDITVLASILSTLVGVVSLKKISKAT